MSSICASSSKQATSLKNKTSASNVRFPPIPAASERGAALDHWRHSKRAKRCLRAAECLGGTHPQPLPSREGRRSRPRCQANARFPAVVAASAVGGSFRPIADISLSSDTSVMIWWDWKTRQRLTLMAAMLVIAAVPWIGIGLVTRDWRGLLGGTAFLFILQIVAWLLFVGMRTGRMPSAYGRSELRAEAPTWFWLTGAAYGGLLLLFCWMVLGVVVGGRHLGF